jgi:hypothetical protein
VTKLTGRTTIQVKNLLGITYQPKKLFSNPLKQSKTYYLIASPNTLTRKDEKIPDGTGVEQRKI